MSAASNLVPGGDSNPTFDVFVHDRQTGDTELVYVYSNGVQENGFGLCSVITLDGRFVAFASLASILVPNDTNGTVDHFVHDRQTGIAERVSVASDGTEGNGLSFCSSSISADGRYVAFASNAANLMMEDIGGLRDVFVHDLQIGVTISLSVDSSGAGGLGLSIPPSISAGGRFVVDSSVAPNLVLGDAGGLADFFVRHHHTGVTQKATAGLSVGQTNGNNFFPL